MPTHEPEPLPTREPMTRYFVIDGIQEREIQAIFIASTVINELNAEGQRRVARYLLDRFGEVT